MAVRRERVELSLRDDFSTPMARAAAAAALLRRELDELDGQNVRTSRSSGDVVAGVDDLGSSSRRTEKDIDKLSGRLRILMDLASGFGPALSPVGAVGIAGISGLTSQLGFAVIGAGTAVLAFQGVGDTLKALNKASLEPTVENLDAAKDALAALSPEARSFVKELSGLQPELERLRNIAAGGLFPGLSRGLNGLESALPRVERLVDAIATELGEIAGDAGESLGSDRWAPFLDFVGTEGPEALGDLATAVGNTAHGLAELWMATDPLNDSFSSWLVQVTEDFDRWAAGLAQTEGFEEFIDYVQTNGPQVAETFGSIANAILQIAEAVAPLGGPALQIIEALADAIAAIADSGAGTAIFGLVAAMGILNTSVRIYDTLNKASFGGPAVARIRAQQAAVGGLSASFKSAAANGALLAAAFVAVDSGSDILDSFKRQSDAAGKSSQSFAELTKNLRDSNLGKYAEDFSIDLDRLALDIAEFGDQGAYYKQVVADLNAANDGLGGKVKTVTDTIGFWTGSTEKAGLANYDLANVVENTTTGLAAMGLQVDKTTGALITNKEAAEQTAAQQQALRASARDTASEFTAFGDSLDDSKVSLGGWLASLERQAAALRDFTNNAKTAGERGLRDGLIKELEKAGPAGALRMKQLADGTDKEIRRANRAWGSLKASAKGYVDFKVPPKVITVDTSKATAAMKKLLALIGQGKGVAGSLDNLPQGTNDPTGLQGLWASGGYTGPGGRNEVAGAVHKGEVVWSQDDVAAHGGPMAVDSMRRERNGYASGGLVGGRLGNFIRNDLDMKYPSTLKQWNMALSESTKLLETEKDKRQALLDQAEGVRSSIRSGYRSDLFGDQGSSVWMSAADRAKAGTGDVFSTLTGDLSNLGALRSATASLKSKGLDGGALADLLSNASLQQVQAFASGSKADVLRYESLYNQRERALTLTGNAGASAAYGPAIRAASAQVAATAEFTRAIDRLDGRVDDVVKSLKRLKPRR